MIHPEVAQYLPQIRGICREFGVSRLEIFGSAATDEFDPERSDVDFLVTYPDGYDLGLWARNLFAFENALSDAIGRDVDVVLLQALRNRWFHREAEKTRMVIFDAFQISEVA